ncbi:hypothetical protein BRD00_10305 [Halobacteriales archaeon QS_8_69_26]|nr:MAG: hypothetical protein BRD00_10305 [Halobacteriales archaeon QS_8_69_26]
MGLAVSGRTRLFLLVLGVTAVGAGFVLWVAPGIVPRPVREPLAGAAAFLPGAVVVWVLAAGAGVYALVRAARGRRNRPAPSEFAGTDPGGTERETPTVGTGFDRAVDAVDNPLESGDDVRERLRATATAALARRTDLSAGAAREAVAAGEWTDDRVAAGFLGGERAPSYPLAERLRGWILPGRAFRRRVDRTVDAVAAVAERSPVDGGRGNGTGSGKPATRDDGSGPSGGDGPEDGPDRSGPAGTDTADPEGTGDGSGPAGTTATGSPEGSG